MENMKPKKARGESIAPRRPMDDRGADAGAGEAEHVMAIHAMAEPHQPLHLFQLSKDHGFGAITIHHCFDVIVNCGL
jgi:hypothetical protein